MASRVKHQSLQPSGRGDRVTGNSGIFDRAADRLGIVLHGGLRDRDGLDLARQRPPP